MLDKDGYRPNVGIILVNGRDEVFWGKRIREHSWQFPQGGIKRGESPEQAMFRELEEETGLRAEHVRIIGRTRNWLRYNVPENWVRREWRGHYRGQKQIWFLLRMVGRDTDVRLRASSHPEFDAWRWNAYWVPLEAVIEFKRDVYLQALTELSRFLSLQRHHDAPRYLRKRRDGPRTGNGLPDGSMPVEDRRRTDPGAQAGGGEPADRLRRHDDPHGSHEPHGAGAPADGTDDVQIDGKPHGGAIGYGVDDPADPSRRHVSVAAGPRAGLPDAVPIEDGPRNPQPL